MDRWEIAYFIPDRFSEIDFRNVVKIGGTICAESQDEAIREVKRQLMDALPLNVILLKSQDVQFAISATRLD